MIRTAIISYNGVELKCKGYYSPYRDNGHDTEPDYECFEIDSVFYNDTDITPLLSAFNFDWFNLECLCIESLKDTDIY